MEKQIQNDNIQNDSGAGEWSLASPQLLEHKIRAQKEILESARSSSKEDRISIKDAIDFLRKLAMRDEFFANLIVESDLVPSLLWHLQPPPQGEIGVRLYQHEIEEGIASTLRFLAIKPEHNKLIVDLGALGPLVNLLKMRSEAVSVNGAIMAAAHAISDLAKENRAIKSCVRIEGGITALRELLEFDDAEVQNTANAALRTLDFESDVN